MYPEWRESFTISPVTSFEQGIRFILKDASRSGASRDEDVGVAFLPLTLLKDQLKHKLLLFFKPPGEMICC